VNWGRIVRKALERPEVLQGIAQVAGSYPKDHIRENIGRSASGGVEAHKPLKNISGEYWARSLPKGAKASATRTVAVTNAKGKTRFVREWLIRGESYRNGGQPLRNTGNMLREMGATATYRGGKIRVRMLGPKYALFQDKGFTTRGPNYIPLTRKGVRGHGTGQNPEAEGLTRGRDFKMAWKGVTVPARPFILPTSDDVVDMGKSIFRALRRILTR
jgi:hypothetical protein